MLEDQKVISDFIQAFTIASKTLLDQFSDFIPSNVE